MLDRTPYSADKATSRGSFGSLPENILSPLYAELVRAGYIVAVEDVRGKYKSEGDYVMNRPLRGPLNPTAVDHSTDAWDTIDWLVKHVPESNGRVGTIGTSYDGFTTLMSLVNPHPALKAAVPINPMVDVWKGDDWFHNGAFRQEMISYVYGQTATKKSDEEWFSAGYDDYATYLRYGSAGAYGDAMGMEQLPFWLRLTEHPAYDEYWQDQAVDRILARAPLTVPTLFVGSEWDQEDIYGAPAVFNAVKASAGNAHLVLGPWHHGQANGAAVDARPARLGLGHRQMVPPERDAAVPRRASEGRPAGEHRPRHRVRGRPQPVAAPRRLAAGLRPRLPGEPHPALPRARQRAQLRRARAHALRLLRLRPGQAGHLPRAAQPLALGAGLDLALLARGRPALRRRPAPTSSPIAAAPLTQPAQASPARRSSTSSPRPAAPTATGWSS